MVEEEQGSSEGSSSRSYSDVVKDSSPSPSPVSSPVVPCSGGSAVAPCSPPVRRLASVVTRPESSRAGGTRPETQWMGGARGPGTWQQVGRKEKRPRLLHEPLPSMTVPEGVSADLVGLCFNYAEPGHVTAKCTGKTVCLRCKGTDHVAHQCSEWHRHAAGMGLSAVAGAVGAPPPLRRIEQAPPTGAWRVRWRLPCSCRGVLSRPSPGFHARAPRGARGVVVAGPGASGRHGAIVAGVAWEGVAVEPQEVAQRPTQAPLRPPGREQARVPVRDRLGDNGRHGETPARPRRPSRVPTSFQRGEDDLEDRRSVGCGTARALLLERFPELDSHFTVHRFWPVDFLFVFDSCARHDFTLHFSPWNRQLQATRCTFRFRVHIEVVGVPAIAWTMDTAKMVLDTSDWVERLGYETTTRSDMGSFRITVWTDDPASIPKHKELWLQEPLLFDDSDDDLLISADALVPDEVTIERIVCRI
ncbi:hypothetical protein ACQ4PT_061226 [Festuca glaucescens]